MMTSSGLVDGSWELSVVVTNVHTTEQVPTERTLRVKGDLHVGGVMLKLVEALGKVLPAKLISISLKDTNPGMATGFEPDS